LKQVNGKIIIGGAFNNVDGIPLNRLARLNAGGLIDSQFNPSTGASDMVLSLALQNDGRILAGGLFATYDGTSVGMIARVYGDPVVPSLAISPATSGSHVVITWPAWASAFTLEQTAILNPGTWQSVTNPASLVNDQMIVILPSAAASQFFRLTSP
jgi:hypothetical protein